MGVVTLSFDNGPDREGTPLILDVLARRGIKASFFIVGRQLDAPEARGLVRRAADEGHWIGNHSLTHKIPLGEDRAPDAPAREIGETQARLGDLATEPILFRPFGGGGKIGPHLLSRGAIDYLARNRYTCVLWNCVPEDWIDAEAWKDRALAECARNPHTLVVLHDVAPKAMRHLDSFVGAALDAGHRFEQRFPTDCILIDRGEIVADLAPLTSTT